MIADALRVEIENHVARVRMRNPLLQHAVAGRVRPATVERYLETMRYLIGNSPPNLRRARELARSTGQTALANYYHEKLLEEDGHVRWAEDDLRVLRETRGASGIEHVPAAIELVSYLRESTEEEPMTYVAYILWAEYFTALAGGELMQHLVQSCGVPVEALTCLAKHVELDVGHSEENFDSIDAMVEDPRMLEPLRKTLHKTMQLFDLICEQIVETQIGSDHRRVAS